MCRTCVELVVELVVFYVVFVELVENKDLIQKSFEINKFYEYYVNYSKFYNKFYTSSTQVLRVLRPGHFSCAQRRLPRSDPALATLIPPSRA